MLASVGVPRLAPLALLLCGCFADPGRYGQGEGSSTSTGEAAADASTTAATPTTGDATASTLPGTDTTTTDATSEPTGTGTTTTTTDPTSPTSSTSPTSATTAPATTGPPPAQCGNGKLDFGEACDDGDFNGGGLCNFDCSAVTCSDAYQNQGESDVDCGGPCQPCAACRACISDLDCGEGTKCVAGICAGSTLITIDYLTNCGQSVAEWPLGPNFPMGQYSITAQGGGGSNSFDASYGWLVQCDGIDITEMSVPFIYATPDAAFQALPIKQLLRAYPGGPLRCGLQDAFCADNSAGVSLSFALVCP